MTDSWRGNVLAPRIFALQTVLTLPGTADDDDCLALVDRVARFETALVADALDKIAGGVSTAAEALSISRRSLYDRLQR